MQAFSRSLRLAERSAGLRTPLKCYRARHTPVSPAYTTSKRFLSSQSAAAGSLAGLKSILRVSEEVSDALATNKPVVALETTIYTHGALGDLGLEDIVRENGAVPAVIGVLGGVPTVGLTPDEITQMVEGSPRKASRRDLAYLIGSSMVGSKINGGTTIAATTLLARLAGIRVFGTGGLGGVHRGGHVSFDISADLTELGRTRMAVVSSGCKGFLDIARTLEYLETQGVLVATFADGRKVNVDFPTFWSRESGIKSPFVVQDEEHAAAIIMAQERLNIETGFLFANPIPEADAIPGDEMKAVIEQAVRESDEQGARGADNTPFILKRIRHLTNGRSVTSNKALVQSNVKRAAKIAAAVSRLVAEGPATPDTLVKQRSSFERLNTISVSVPESSTTKEVTTEADILVAGSVAVDLSCDYTGVDAIEDPIPQLHTSNPAHITQSIGGVGHNVALAAHRVSQHTKVRLCSMVGKDLAGSTVLASLESNGMDTSCIQQIGHDEYPGSRTAQYVSVNDGNKHLVLAMADMDIFTAQPYSHVWDSAVRSSKPSWLVVDGNWKDHDIRAWIRAAKRSGARIAFEPVSREKSTRLFCPQRGLESLGVFPFNTVDLTTPNQYELASMHAAAQRNEYFEDERWWGVIDAFGMKGARDRFVMLTSAAMTDAGIPQQAIRLLPFIPTILTKLGSEGAFLTTILRKDDPRLYDAAHEPFILTRSINDHPDIGGVYMRMFPSVEQVTDVVSVNGIGDTFLGTLVAGLAHGGKIENLVNVAQKAAVLTLRSPQSVSERLGLLERELIAAATL